MEVESLFLPRCPSQPPTTAPARWPTSSSVRLLRCLAAAMASQVSFPPPKPILSTPVSHCPAPCFRPRSAPDNTPSALSARAARSAKQYQVQAAQRQSGASALGEAPGDPPYPRLAPRPQLTCLEAGVRGRQPLRTEHEDVRPPDSIHDEE